MSSKTITIALTLTLNLVLLFQGKFQNAREKSKPPDIPPELASPEFESAWADWLAMPGAKRKESTPTRNGVMLKKRTRRWAGIGRSNANSAYWSKTGGSGYSSRGRTTMAKRLDVQALREALPGIEELRRSKAIPAEATSSGPPRPASPVPPSESAWREIQSSRERREAAKATAPALAS